MIPDDTKVADIDFGEKRITTQIRAVARWARWDTAGDLRERSDADLLRAPNFGKACLRAIRDVLGPGRKS